MTYDLDQAPPDARLDEHMGVFTWAPSESDLGRHEIYVTACDQALCDSESFEIIVESGRPDNGAALVEYTVVARDGAGNKITTVSPGTTFYLDIYVKDLRMDDARGVFAAYVDLTLDTHLADWLADSLKFDAFENGRPGSLKESEGLADEVGGFASITPSGAVMSRVASIGVRAGDLPGRIDFRLDASDMSPRHDTLLYNVDRAVTIDEIVFGQTSVEVESCGSRDTDCDGETSPLDALRVINWLNTEDARPYESNLDVDRDGAISPLDALLIINQLNSENEPRMGQATNTVVSDRLFDGWDDRGSASLVSAALRWEDVESIDQALLDRDVWHIGSPY